MDYPGKCLSSASFCIPERIVVSAWTEHAPFAFWLVDAHRPRVLVELGTHHGYSYLAFCQQVRRMGLAARCFAVDTWRGDEHAGFYGDEVLADLRQYHDSRYSDFSRLIRSTFDEATGQFADGSIDLLHIDGRHRYEDVSHDFELWNTKLSSRAIVLLHDTQVKEGGFGVFRFWKEAARKYPHFEFKHGFGLGVLGVGPDLAKTDFALFSASRNEQAARAVGDAYARLGAALTERIELESLRREAAQLKRRLIETPSVWRVTLTSG